MTIKSITASLRRTETNPKPLKVRWTVSMAEKRRVVQQKQHSLWEAACAHPTDLAEDRDTGMEENSGGGCKGRHKGSNPMAGNRDTGMEDS